MKILVFGGNGLLGRELLAIAAERNINIDSASRSGEKCKFNLDISFRENFESLPINEYDFIINAASILPSGNYLDDKYLNNIYRSNILGIQNICNWIQNQTSVKKLINCSTLVVNNKPWPSPLLENYYSLPLGHHVLYSSSKLMQEAIVETFSQINKIPVAQLRFSALYGPEMKWEGVIPNFIQAAKDNQKIQITNGDKVFADFLHIQDAAKIIFAILHAKQAKGIINAASGKEISLTKLANLIANTINLSAEVCNINNDDFNELRAHVSIEKLSNFIDTNTFIKLSDGIKELIQK